jgi:protein-tyrosine phosphatase
LKLIDLHCHLLPGIDDGSKSVAMSLEMARMACADGINTIVCTPHILPTVYENKGPDIKAAVASLQQAVSEAGIPLQLLSGADVHIVPDLVAGLNEGRIITVAGSRYLLLEPPHHVMPPQFSDCIFRLQAAGYVAILTHPERLSWIESQYALIRAMVNKGLWLQLTAGSLSGRFGRRPRYWAERMLDEGLCHVVATDAHDTASRPPQLARAKAMAEVRVGASEAINVFDIRPQGVIDNANPATLPSVPGDALSSEDRKHFAQSAWRALAQRFRRRRA